MDKNFWIERWRKKEIGFHQLNYNEFLIQYGKDFFHGIQNIFIPLCGKTKDILWFYHLNKNILGIEISEIACYEFFEENKIPFHIETYENFHIFISKDKKIYIFNGDFFSFHKKTLQFFPYQIHGTYDRAALIALPTPMRKEYAKKMYELFYDHKPFKYFLITMEYELKNPNENLEEYGPPFCVKQEEIYKIYSPFKIQNIDEKPIERKNVIQCKEKLYFMEL